MDRQEGIICSLDRKHKKGYLKPKDGKSILFLYKEVRQEDKYLLELGVKVKFSKDGGKVVDIRVIESIPYTFIAIPKQNGKPQSIVDTPVFHNGERREKELLSGEIRCTMTALTPLLVANDQYLVEQVEGAVLRKLATGEVIELPKSWGLSYVSKEKKILEPLRLNDSDGSVLISGSGPKGAIRQSIGALLAAPMERVTEKSYSYRPNLKVVKQKLRWAPAIVEEVNEAEIRVKVLDSKSDTVYFRKNKAPDNYQKFSYVGGIDGTGKLAKAFRENMRVHSTVWVNPKAIEKATSTIIPTTVIEHYERTQEHLGDTENGHLRKDHPHSSKFSPAEVARDIRKNKKLRKDQLIYVEIEGDNEDPKIHSIGHNFRYRWRYVDTICSVYKDGEYQRRSIVKPLPEETTQNGCEHSVPSKLSGARNLFGYVSGEENEGVKGIGKGDFQKLAGRIAFNMAVEVVDGKDEQKRFINAEKDFVVALKILGAPRPSAVEYYLEQEPLSKRRDDGILITYGDLQGEDPPGELRGRKFYLHQPQAAESSTLYEEQDTKIADKQSSLARFISKPNTRFRFTIRFRDLRLWELGLLIFVLNPNKQLDLLSESFPKIAEYLESLRQLPGDDPLFAHKLGHGRPLGMGSVCFALDCIRVWENNPLPEMIDFSPEKRDESLKAFAEKLQPSIDNETLWNWLQVHQYKGRPTAAYSTFDGEIHKYHTELRKGHSEGRRNERGAARSNKQKEKRNQRPSGYSRKGRRR